MTGPTTPEQLVDGFGRVHRDLRISVTDRCNFRCTYCMPEEGMQWMAREEILTFEEITRIARVFVERYGVDSIRLTGGEPTVRAHLPVLVAKLAALGVELAMTTNGSTLRSQAQALADAGVNIDDMHLGRSTQSGDASLMVLATSPAVPREVADALRSTDGIETVHVLS
ncbi:MAG TPA: hypothetical protein DCS55_16240 [Acidimicrobiaceae bacterium]|nr:hypothetical protein [Acidimicrobiaceae bacterium]